jgi:hypothetical protein
VPREQHDSGARDPHGSTAQESGIEVSRYAARTWGGAIAGRGDSLRFAARRLCGQAMKRPSTNATGSCNSSQIVKTTPSICLFRIGWASNRALRESTHHGALSSRNCVLIAANSQTTWISRHPIHIASFLRNQ